VLIALAASLAAIAPGLRNRLLRGHRG
jgi:hypothetical protein